MHLHHLTTHFRTTLRVFYVLIVAMSLHSCAANVGDTGNNPSQSENEVGENDPIDTILPTTNGPRGYQSRKCVYDLNANGIIGESSDCQICRTDTVSDIDGNGVIDVQIYVDADQGSDTSGNGTATAPWKTLAKGLAYFTSNPPLANQLTALCFVGRAIENNLAIPTSGAAGTYSAGTGDYAFEYARFPFVISGWDIDSDGSYYPVDPDDVSLSGHPPVIDGTTATGSEAWAFVNHNNDDYLTLAHFRAEHFGVSINSTAAGFFDVGQFGTNTVDYVHYHDLVLAEMNSELASEPPSGGSSRQVFHHFLAGVRYEMLDNLIIDGWSGYLARGSASQASGPIMFRNITAKAKAPDGSSALDVACQKLWSNHDDIRYLDNYFTTNIRHCEGGATPGFMCDGDSDCGGGTCVGEWRPAYPSKSMYCLGAFNGSQDVLIRNNEIRGFKTAISMQPDAIGYGPFSNLGPTIIDKNVILMDTYWGHCAGDSANLGETCLGLPGECPGGYCAVVGTGLQFRETHDVCSENPSLHCGGVDCGGATPCAPDCNGGADGFCHSALILDTTVTNNIISSPQRLSSCVVDSSGSEHVQSTSTFTFVGNTCHAPNGEPWDYAGWKFSSDKAYVTENIAFKNNISSFTDGEHLRLVPSRSGWQADGNAYSPGAGWNIDGMTYTNLTDWQSATGQDTNSNVCSANFVDASQFDFHLSADDACAIDSGVDVSTVLTGDIDGELRPQGLGWDIGVDEFVP